MHPLTTSLQAHFLPFLCGDWSTQPAWAWWESFLLRATCRIQFCLTCASVYYFMSPPDTWTFSAKILCWDEMHMHLVHSFWTRMVCTDHILVKRSPPCVYGQFGLFYCSSKPYHSKHPGMCLLCMYVCLPWDGSLHWSCIFSLVQSGCSRYFPTNLKGGFNAHKFFPILNGFRLFGFHRAD